MKILVGCEQSGRVRDAFRHRGHDAYSCDIEKGWGEFPQYHIRDDVRNHLDSWDMIIAFPPCAWLCKANSRARGTNAELNALRLVRDIMEADCPKICVENPQYSSINRHIRPADQTIEPFEYGEPWIKSTSLWLKGLPILRPENIVQVEGRWMDMYRDTEMRSRTFKGIAAAMARQWG